MKTNGAKRFQTSVLQVPFKYNRVSVSRLFSGDSLANLGLKSNSLNTLISVIVKPFIYARNWFFEFAMSKKSSIPCSFIST